LSVSLLLRRIIVSRLCCDDDVVIAIPTGSEPTGEKVRQSFSSVLNLVSMPFLFCKTGRSLSLKVVDPDSKSRYRWGIDVHPIIPYTCIKQRIKRPRTNATTSKMRRLLGHYVIFPGLKSDEPYFMHFKHLLVFSYMSRNCHQPSLVLHLLYSCSLCLKDGLKLKSPICLQINRMFIGAHWYNNIYMLKRVNRNDLLLRSLRSPKCFIFYTVSSMLE
jgi:hypothetical protein